MPSASRSRVSATPTNVVTGAAIPTDAATVELEIALLRGLLRARCVGSAKDAVMLGTHHYVSHTVARPVTVDELWAHLRTLYDPDQLDALVRRSRCEWAADEGQDASYYEAMVNEGEKPPVIESALVTDDAKLRQVVYKAAGMPLPSPKGRKGKGRASAPATSAGSASNRRQSAATAAKPRVSKAAASASVAEEDEGGEDGESSLSEAVESGADGEEEDDRTTASGATIDVDALELNGAPLTPAQRKEYEAIVADARKRRLRIPSPATALGVDEEKPTKGRKKAGAPPAKRRKR